MILFSLPRAGFKPIALGRRPAVCDRPELRINSFTAFPLEMAEGLILRFVIF